MKLFAINFFLMLKTRAVSNLSAALVFCLRSFRIPLAIAFAGLGLLVCYRMPSSIIARASHARCARCGSASEPVTIYKRCD